MEYKCEIPVEGSEKRIISKLIKQVKKEWFVKEVVKSSPGFSVFYEDKFEEGENICYFVKKENYLYYCGPINVRQKKMKTHRLWIFDYLFYLNNRMCKIKNLSYMWDTLFLNKIPENMIFNPCVVGNFDGVWKMLKAKAVYDAEQIKDLIVVDMNPNSDDIDRTYTLTFYKNSYEIKRLEGICKFEPSLLRQGIFYYTFFDVVADITAYNDNDIIDFVRELGSFDQYIMISSSAVYPEYGVQPFLEESEKSENKFWGSYGTDKIAAEKALLESVKDAYILRPPYLYGPMNNVYREAFVFDCALADRKFYLPKDGSMKLQFFHVKDLCRLMEVIIKDKPQERILNVGNVEAVSIKDWVTKCYESLGKIPDFVNVYEDIEQRNYFSFYNYEYYLDVSRQNKIYPETISLEDGLRDSVKWYLEHSTEVNKKPYFKYINENLVED